MFLICGHFRGLLKGFYKDLLKIKQLVSIYWKVFDIIIKKKMLTELLSYYKNVV